MSSDRSVLAGRPVAVAAVLPRILQARRRTADRIGALRRSAGFPWAGPTWPGGVVRPPVRPTLGVDFETEWARTPAARVARAMVLDGLIGPAVAVLASPTVTGLDRLDGLQGPVIFAANHASHLDTLLLLTSLPARFRHRTVVAAAADYFFDRRVKAVGSALALGAIPIERASVSRRSLHQATGLLADRWNLVIFPEGGRTPDGWGREFKAGAAYIATRCGVPVVPVHIEGSRRVLRKGGGGLHRSRTNVVFGSALTPGRSRAEAKELGVAIEPAIAVLADELATDWWAARRRAASGTTPGARGPEAAAWRRAWARGEGQRTVSGPRWPA